LQLSKTQIALYAALAAGCLAALALKLPHWLMFIMAAVVALADYLWERRHPHQEEQIQPGDLLWPWQTVAFWIVLALFCGLAVALAFAGAPPGIIALICGIGLAFYIYDVAARITVKRARRQRRSSGGPRDWTLFGISAAFCVLSLLTLRDDWRAAVGTIAFFGACAFVFSTVILRRRRERKWTRATVRVTGGINIHINGTRFACIALTCCLVGAIMFFVEIGAPIVLRMIGAFICLIGVALSVAVALGLHTRQFMRFDPEGLIVGERAYEARIDWDNIADVVTLEYASNAFVGITLVSLESVRVEPATRIETFLRNVGNARGLFGTDLSILSGNFGIDSVVLAGALHRYATQPHARQELVTRARLTADRVSDP
jgi:hypothetical protein